MPAGSAAIVFADADAQILPTAIGDIPYWIRFPEGFGERFTRGQGNSTTLKIWVKWEDAPDFKKYALGFTEGEPGHSIFYRQPPLQAAWANNQYLSDLVADEVTNPDSDGPSLDIVLDDWPRGDYVGYIATFASLNYPIKTDRTILYNETRADGIRELGRYVRKTWRTIPKERRMPGWTFETDESSPKQVPEVGFLPVYETEYIYTLLEVPYDLWPEASINSTLGKVNDDVFDGFAAETCFFKGVVGELQPYVGPSGELYLDLPYLIGYKPTGWNNLPTGIDASGGPVFTRVRQVGASSGTKPPFASADFSVLFKPRAS